MKNDIIKLFILLSGLFRDKTSVLVEGCNKFNDYCDDFNEELNDLNTNKVLQLKPLSNLPDVNNYNKTTTIEPNHRQKRSHFILRDAEKTSKQVTTILDNLLFSSGYDKQIRPQINGPPVQVTSEGTN